MGPRTRGRRREFRSRKPHVAGRPRTQAPRVEAKRKRWPWLAAASLIVSIVAIIASFFTNPVNDKLRDIELAERPALIAEVRESWNDGLDGWTWYFPNGISREEVESLEETHNTLAYSRTRDNWDEIDRSTDNIMREAGGKRVGL